MQHQYGGVVLEDRTDVDNRQFLGDGQQRVGAVCLTDLGLPGGEFLHDERVGAAWDQGDVESRRLEQPGRLRLEQTAVFRFGDPIQLHDDFGRLTGGRGLGPRRVRGRLLTAAGEQGGEDDDQPDLE